jgi:hypothetical protein
MGMAKCMTQKLLTIIGIACFSVFFILMAELSLRDIEKSECVKWEQQSKDYQGWWSTNWQKEQCLQYGIKLK